MKVIARPACKCHSMWPVCTRNVSKRGLPFLRKRQTVEEPDARVVGDDTQRDGVHRRHLDSISSHGVLLAFDDRWVECWVSGCVVFGSAYNLHLVSVQVAFPNICVNIDPRVSGVRVTYKGCFPASPFFKTISKTFM
jgi:hypothetical protein